MVKKVLVLTLAVLMLVMTGCTVQVGDAPAQSSSYNPATTVWKAPPKDENSGNKGSGGTVVDPIDDSTIPPEEWTSLAKNGAAEFIVVSASSEYDEMASQFAIDLGQRVGVAFRYRSSSQTADMTLNQIVIGEKLTKVLSSGTTLTYNGNLSTMVKTGTGKLKIHITGNHKDAVRISKDKFLSGCLSRYRVYNAEGVFESFTVPNPRICFMEQRMDSYILTSPALLGRDLSEYKLVFPKEMTAIEQYLAKYLIQEIGGYTGCVMNTVADSAPESECEIIFGNTIRAGSQALNATLKQGEFAIRSEGTKIYVAYENYLVTTNVRSALHELYFEKHTGQINICEKPNYSANQVTKADSSYVRVMTSNIVAAGDMDAVQEYDQKLGISWQQRVQIQGSMMLAYLPDFVGLQEMQQCSVNGVTATMHTELKKIISSEYSFVEYEGMNVTDYWTPIVYRHTVWQLEAKDVLYPDDFDTEMHRWQWAMFSKIDDPDTEEDESQIKCIVLNLHYPTGGNVKEQLAAAAAVNDKIFELKAKYKGVPIFLTGDFNTREGSATYNRMIQQTFFKSASPGNGAIDLVIYDPNLATPQTGLFIGDDFISMTSDHRPFFADFALK